jgi:hypothetical protein
VKWKQFSALTFLLTMTLGSVSVVNVSAQEQTSVRNDWTISPPPSQVPSQGIWFAERIFIATQTSYLGVQSTPCSVEPCPKTPPRSETVCTSLESAPCQGDAKLSYQAFLPVCEVALDTDCIQSVWIKRKGEKKSLEMVRYMPEKSPLHYSGSKSANLPSGLSASIWRSPSDGESTELFAVNATIKGVRGLTKDSLLRFQTVEVEVGIDRVVEYFDDFNIPRASTDRSGFSIKGTVMANGRPSIGPCAAVDIGVCAKRLPPLKGDRYGLSLRLNDAPQSWIHGRIANPDFSINKSDSGPTVWNVEGEPVIVPVASAWLPKSDIRNIIPSWTVRDPSITSYTGPFSSGSNAVARYLEWEAVMKDRAEALQSRWSFRSLLNDSLLANGKRISQCVKPGAIAGVVVANAMVYQGDPPLWNEKERSFDYVVAGPHLLPDGSKNLGMYALKMEQSFARCVYGFGDVPLMATVSVISEGEVKKVSTSSINVNDEWVNLAVSGFTYSSPTLRVSLETVNERSVNKNYEPKCKKVSKSKKKCRA